MTVDDTEAVQWTKMIQPKCCADVITCPTQRQGKVRQVFVTCAVDVFGANGRTLFAAAITTLSGPMVESPATFGTAEINDVGKSPIDTAFEASTTRSVVLDEVETMLSTPTAKTGRLDDDVVENSRSWDAEVNSNLLTLDKPSLSDTSSIFTPSDISVFISTSNSILKNCSLYMPQMQLHTYMQYTSNISKFIITLAHINWTNNIAELENRASVT